MKNTPSSSSIITQLKRISGQIDGIINMIESGRECMQVVDQIMAARNSLSRVGSDYLSLQVQSCTQQGDKKQLNKIISKLFRI